MTDDGNINEQIIRDLATEVGLAMSEEAARDLVGPIDDIISSMEPVTTAPERSRKFPPVDVLAGNDPHNAFVTRCRVQRKDTSGPLADRTVALKDNIALAGVPLTAGSGMLEEYVPTHSAPVAERLLDAGATIVGKANMDEFAFGPTGETSYYGPTTNPHDPAYTPGGSSSGSAVAVVAGQADLALGTDTGGSVRIPASQTGAIGVKPTHGRIPKEGIVELAGSLDTVGVLGSDLEEVAECLSVLADGVEIPADVEAVEPSELVLGVPDSLFDSPVSSAVAERCSEVVSTLVDAGATRKKPALPERSLSSAVWRVVTMSELYQYITGNGLPYRQPGGTKPPFGAALRGASCADLDRIGPALKQYLLIGAYLVHTDGGRRYGHALDASEYLRDSVEAALADVDVLVSPTTPTTAFSFGEFSRDSSPPINANTHLFNITGHPAVSVPCATVDGLPVGFQVIGDRGADVEVLRVAKAILDLVDA